MQLDRLRQLTQTEERLHRQLICRFRPPIERLRIRLGSRLRGNDIEVLASDKPALEWMRGAIGGRESSLLRVFVRRPFRMACLPVNLGHRRMNAMQLRQLLQGLVIEEERTAILASLNARIS